MLEMVKCLPLPHLEGHADRLEIRPEDSERQPASQRACGHGVGGE